MKKTLLFSFLFIAPFFLQAQNEYYHFFTGNRLCSVDNSISPPQYNNWDIYKTLNDEWDGAIDSSFCGRLNIFEEIDLSTVGAGETFFVRRHFTDLNKIPLQSNGLFGGNFNGNIDSLNNLNFGNNCNGGYCTSLMIGIEIPDSQGTNTTLRWHEIVPTVSTLGIMDGNFCIPVEYFDNNYLRELVFKVTVQNPSGSLFLDYLRIEEVVSSNIYTVRDSFQVFANTLGQYDFPVSLALNLLFAKSDTSLYPSSNNLEFIDLKPVPNVDTITTMNFSIEYGGSMTSQPFVDLRGGYLLNDSTQRHQYNIINNGGTYCSNIVERNFTGGNNYIHNAGSVEFGGRTACMQFSEGSKLVVGKNTRLDYGFNGVGNLALRSRASIEIGEGSELHINNNVMLFESKGEHEPQQIYMTLHEGSKLSFGKLANIGNEYSIDGSMKLNIYMKGGEVDLSQLSVTSRALVNLIYDVPQELFIDNIKVLGNPIQDKLRFSIINDEPKTISVRITASNGQVLQNTIIVTQKGYDEIEIPTLNLANGLYFMTIQSDEQVFSDKIIVLK